MYSIKGQVVTPGHPYQQESYRSELSVLYASVAVINVLMDFFLIMDRSITLAYDNLLACRMSSYDALGTNPSSCTQFNLVMAIQHIITPLLMWIHKHVKATRTTTWTLSFPLGINQCRDGYKGKATLGPHAHVARG
jgi:hypothetical protein